MLKILFTNHLGLLPPHGNQELHLPLASCFFPPRALQLLTTSPSRAAILTSRGHMLSVRGPVSHSLSDLLHANIGSWDKDVDSKIF